VYTRHQTAKRTDSSIVPQSGVEVDEAEISDFYIGGDGHTGAENAAFTKPHRSRIAYVHQWMND
jgi:hypothetical protein